MTFGVRMGPEASPERWARDTRLFRRGTGSFYRKAKSIHFLLTRDRREVMRFVNARYPTGFSLRDRAKLIADYTTITNAVRGYHTLEEMLVVTDRILRLANRPGLTIVEAGAGSGSSTAKLSLATRIAGGRLLCFDSFKGIPPNDEVHTLLDGRPLQFRAGAFRGRLGSVRDTVARYGAPEVVEYRKGLFEDSLRGFRDPVDVVLLDVDLIASTRVCVRTFYPLLRAGGVLLSQDGHIRATVDLLSSATFWRDEVGVEPPRIEGLGSAKLLEIRRDR